MVAFELVKVRRQLEYTIANSKGVHLAKAPGTVEAVKDIFRTSGIGGLYTGFRLHLSEFWQPFISNSNNDFYLSQLVTPLGLCSISLNTMVCAICWVERGPESRAPFLRGSPSTFPWSLSFVDHLLG